MFWSVWTRPTSDYFPLEGIYCGGYVKLHPLGHLLLAKKVYVLINTHEQPLHEIDYSLSLDGILVWPRVLRVWPCVEGGAF